MDENKKDLNSENENEFEKEEVEETAEEETEEKTEKDVKEEKKEKKKKRLFPIWARILCIVLSVILIIGIAGVIFIYSKLNKINRYDPNSIETIAPEDETFETDPYKEGLEIVEPDDIIWDDDVNVYSSKDIQNILLIGQDTRTGGVTGRSDSMMILTIDHKREKLKVTSLMRDMYVQIPGYSDNRINTAYVFGGYPLLRETIEKNLGISVDAFVEVDFFAFTKIVDILDGIYIDLNEDEAYMLKAWGHRTTVGRNRLDGEAALSYCTMRQIGNSDYERTQRQRRALSSIYARLRDTVTISKALDLVDEIFPLVTTDMSNGEIISLAVDLYSMDIEGVEQYRIPADGTFTPMYVREMAVLVPDLAACRAYLWDIIYGVKTEE